MSRRAPVLTLAVAIALLALSVIIGLRDYTQSVVVTHDQPAFTTDTTAAPQYEKVVLHCPGPLASAANMGAYYPVNGRIVSPTLGPRPFPCLVRRGRLQLEVWMAVGLSLIVAAAAIFLLWRRAREGTTPPTDPFFEPISRAARRRSGMLCESFELFQRQDDEHKFVFLERWDSIDSHHTNMADNILASGHLGRILPLLVGPPDNGVISRVD